MKFMVCMVNTVKFIVHDFQYRRLFQKLNVHQDCFSTHIRQSAVSILAGHEGCVWTV